MPGDWAGAAQSKWRKGETAKPHWTPAEITSEGAARSISLETARANEQGNEVYVKWVGAAGGAGGVVELLLGARGAVIG